MNQYFKYDPGFFSKKNPWMKNYICGLWDENEIIFNQILGIRLLIDKQTDEKKPWTSTTRKSFWKAPFEEMCHMV